VKLYYIIRRVNRRYINTKKINVIVILVIMSIVYLPIRIIIGVYYRIKNKISTEDLLVIFFRRIYGLIGSTIIISIFFDYIINIIEVFNIFYGYILLIILSLSFIFVRRPKKYYGNFSIEDKLTALVDIEIKLGSSIVGVIIQEIRKTIYYSKTKVKLDFNYICLLTSFLKETEGILEEKK
jgi:hypothetical protein